MSLIVILMILAGCAGKEEDAPSGKAPSLTENESGEENAGNALDSKEEDALSGEAIGTDESSKYPITDDNVKNLECYVTYGRWNEGCDLGDALSSDLITLCRGQYPFLALSQENVEKYNELFQTVIDFNDEIYEKVTNTFDECCLEAKNMFNQEGSTYLLPFYAKSDIYAVRADSVVLSVVRTSDNYMGGVHPANGIGGYVYDTRTGKRLWAEDIFTDTNRLVTALSEQLLKENPTASLPKDLKSAVKELLENKDTQSFTVNHTGVTFYFSTYVIASYADGNLFATLPFSEYGDIINEKYMHIAKDYTCPIMQGVCVDNPTLNIAALELDGEYNRAYYVNRGGKERVYFDKYSEDGFGGDFFEYQVEHGNPILWIAHENMYLHQNCYSEESMGQTLFTDPNAEFTVCSTLNTISYNEGTRKASFDSDGYISVINQTDYEIAPYSGLTLKQDMNVRRMEMDENGDYTEFLGSTVIPSGTNVYFVRTDNRSYVDMFSDDGVYFRIFMDDVYSGDLSQYIGGVERSEYFSNVIRYENMLLKGRWELYGIMNEDGKVESSLDKGYEAYLNISEYGNVQYYFRDRNDSMHLTDNPNLALAFNEKNQGTDLWPHEELENANWYAALSGTFCDEEIYMMPFSDGRLEMLINDNTKGSKYAGSMRLIFHKQ